MSSFYRTNVICLIFLGWMSGCAASSNVAYLSTAAKVPAVEPFPTPIVQLRGSSDQLGAEHGQKLSRPIHVLFDHYVLVFIGSGMKKFIALSAADLFEAQLRPEHREELHAMANRLDLDERETMLGQCFLDISQLSACSTIALPANASPDHVARMGRNLDFKSLKIADKYSVLFVVRPNDGRNAYAAVGWPGMIGVLSGMNQYGLCLANMEVPRSVRLPTAMPYTLLYRTVLERCRSVQDAVALLQSTPRQTANNLMLMDANGARAVVELTPDAVQVRWGAENVPLISTNHQRNQDVDSPGLCWRYDYLHVQGKAMFGIEDEPHIEQMLAHVGSKSTLQSMVFEPANRVIYLATGTGASSKHFYRLDLTPYFQ